MSGFCKWLCRPLTRFVDAVFSRFAGILLVKADERLLHPQRQLLLAAQRDAAEYIKAKMPNAVVCKTQQDVLTLAISRMLETGSVLEFGVGGGDSIRLIAEQSDRLVHGFDSFEGLPEDWGGRHEARGHYSRNGRPPVVPGNVILHNGWFVDTLPRFLAGNDEPAAFIHIDCDLYSSTKTALDLLTPRIGPGTVIAFDEYFNYASWREHEFRAFQEFVDENSVRYRYLCWGYQQAVAVIDVLELS